MKYINYSYWWNSSHINNHIQTAMHNLMLGLYYREFKKARKNMSKKFIRDYYLNLGYHDWLIKRIHLPESYKLYGNNIILDLESYDYTMKKSIIFSEVKEFHISLSKYQKNHWPDTVLMDEFLLVDNEYISYELLTSKKYSLYLVCKHVDLK